MSQIHNIQDATGDVVRHGPVGISFTIRPSAPTASAAGFEKGCRWVNTAGSVGSTEYTNVGTNTSAIWVNIT